MRATLGCGYLPEEARGPDPLRAPEGPQQPADGPADRVCAGYLVSLPEVLEAGRALSWRKEGQLKDYYDGAALTTALKDAIDVLDTELRRVESYAMDKPTQ